MNARILQGHATAIAGAIMLLAMVAGTRGALAQPVFTGLCGQITVVNNTNCPIDLNFQSFPGSWPPISAPASSASLHTLPSAAQLNGLATINGTIVSVNSPLSLSVEGCNVDDWTVVGVQLGLDCCCNVCINPCTCTITINPANGPCIQ